MWVVAAVRKIINERLSHKIVILSPLHLHVESYVIQQGKQRSWLLGPLRCFLCEGCHRNVLIGCGWEADSSWGHLSPGATGTPVQICSSVHLTQTSPFPLSFCRGGDNLHPHTYQESAEVSNASLPRCLPQTLSSLGLKGKSEEFDDPGSCETPFACWTPTPGSATGMEQQL